MTKCYLCGNDITEDNQTEEHIIPNAIGGRLTSSRLICKECNSQSGDTTDANLSRQFEFFANWLDIKRERGHVRNVEMLQESTGEKFLVTPKGVPLLSKPIVKEKIIGDKTKIAIKVQNIKGLKTVLAGLKRRYPSINIEQSLANANMRSEYLSSPLCTTLRIGGKEMLPAILKMAISYYIEKTEDIESVREAITDLKNSLSSRVELIIFKDFLFDLSSNEVTHSIFINCSKHEHKIYAIIELFSAIQFVVRLSSNYEGNDFQDLYVYDVLGRKQIEKDLKTIPSFEYIFAYHYSPSDQELSLSGKRVERVIAIGAKRKKQGYISEAIDKTLASTLKRLPEGQLITEEDGVRIVDELMKNLAPLVMLSDTRLATQGKAKSEE